MTIQNSCMNVLSSSLLDSPLKKIPSFQYLFKIELGHKYQKNNIFMCSVMLATCASDLFLSDLWLPQCAEDHICTLYLLGVGPLALQPAQSIF